jgi:hypothetical protein
MLNKSYYEELHLRKDSGEKLYFESITYIELAQLWWDEVIPDYEIAKLYEVKKEIVRKRRYNLGIKQKEMFVRDRISEFLDLS